MYHCVTHFSAIKTPSLVESVLMSLWCALLWRQLHCGCCKCIQIFQCKPFQWQGHQRLCITVILPWFASVVPLNWAKITEERIFSWLMDPFHRLSQNICKSSKVFYVFIFIYNRKLVNAAAWALANFTIAHYFLKKKKFLWLLEQIGMQKWYL